MAAAEELPALDVTVRDSLGDHVPLVAHEVFASPTWLRNEASDGVLNPPKLWPWIFRSPQ